MRVYGYIAFVLLLAAMGCGKNRHETFSGTVYDDSSHAVLPNVEVMLFDYYDYSASNLAVLKTTYTGGDGKFTMTYNIRKSKVYALVCKYANYNTYLYSFKKGQQTEDLKIYLKK